MQQILNSYSPENTVNACEYFDGQELFLNFLISLQQGFGGRKNIQLVSYANCAVVLNKYIFFIYYDNHDNYSRS